MWELLRVHRKEWRLWATGVVLVALLLIPRFFGTEHSPFHGDEPKIQLLWDSYAREGRVPTSGIAGTRGLSYGPTALWLYSPLRWLTDSVAALSVWHILFFLTGQLCVLWVIRGFEGWTAAFVLGSLWFASPELTHFSQKPWDNTFLVFTLGVSLLAWARGSGVGLGVGLGLSIGTHLMSAASVLSFGLDWLFRRKMRALLIATCVAGACLIPYFLALLAKGFQAAPGYDSVLDKVVRGVLQVPAFVWGQTRWFTTSEFGYFLGGTLRGVKSYMDPLTGLLTEFDFALPLRVAAILGLGLSLLKWRESSRLMKLGLVSFGATYVYYVSVGLDVSQPHYGFPIWWVSGLGLWTVWKRIPMRFQIHTRIYLVAVLWINANFHFAFQRKVWADGGVRSVHYGPSPASVAVWSKSVCERDDVKELKCIAIHLPDGMPSTVDPMSLEYGISHEPTCNLNAVRIQWRRQGSPQPMDCREIALEYETDSARLRVRTEN
jgi:hypothetical protein